MSTIIAEDLRSPYALNYVSTRVWVVYTMVTTTAVNDSLGVSSLTDNGAGDTTINMSRVMVDAGYSVDGGGQRSQTSQDRAPEKGYRRTGLVKGMATPTASFRYQFSTGSTGDDSFIASCSAYQE